MSQILHSDGGNNTFLARSSSFSEEMSFALPVASTSDKAFLSTTDGGGDIAFTFTLLDTSRDEAIML